MFCLLCTLVGCRHDTPKPPSASPANIAQVVPVFYSGLISLEVGDDGNAATLLPQAAQLAPQEPATWANLGLFRLRQGNFDEARKYLEKARDLAPENGPIEALLGLLESRQGHFAEAVTHLKKALELAPDDLRARYALIEAIQQQSGANVDAEIQPQLDALATSAPDNLFVAFEQAIRAAKSGDAAKMRPAIQSMASQSGAWTSDAQKAFKDAQTLASGTDTRVLIAPLTGLRHILEASPEYQRQKARIVLPSGVVGAPIEKFIVLPSPSPKPAPPDMALIISGGNSGRDAQPANLWGQFIWTTATSLSALVVDGRSARISQGQSDWNAPLPGAIGPHGVCTLDWNNDFKIDLCFATKSGVRLFQQNANGLSDITTQSKLPPDIVNGNFTGAWAADIEGDGDLDIVLGSPTGPPRVLRNNNDGAWAAVTPFGADTAGIRDFAWGDFDGDSLPDAAFVDAQGRLVVYENKRAGHFEKWTVPAGFEKCAALSVADVERRGQMSLVVLREDGGVTALSRSGEAWTNTPIATTAGVPNSGTARMLWDDLDNNGGLDLLISTPQQTQVFLSDEAGKLNPLAAPIMGQIFGTYINGYTDGATLIGLSKGEYTTWTMHSSKKYGWQNVQLKAAAVGDNRNNSYGIGGEIELRAALLYTKQIVTQPVVHFGLGENVKADYIRIVWPNGSPQGEFSLRPNQIANTPERLKGSCPWLFADDGQGMKFVTDFIWRSPLGLRINAQVTAGVAQTRDWVRIRGDQLKPRNGFYNLSVTAELWETHFFDHIALKTIDHPANTELRVDERFAIPPPDLKAELMTPPQPIYHATDDKGQDVTETVRVQDGRYLDTFGRGLYQGVTNDHYVQLDFGPNVPVIGKLWLVAYGWIHPTDSSINVAISQGNHAPPRDLSLEIPDGKGGWQAVRPHLGFPEGKNKTVLIDLTGLFRPGIPYQARLRTNLEIYWDFIGTATGLPPAQMQTHNVALDSAILGYRGFSVTHQPNASSPETPDYVVAGTVPRWLDLIGYYTRWGETRELLANADDRYVIMNAGDELKLRFPAQSPPPPGWIRDYILVGDGWVKDGDFNTGFSKTVLPLPLHDRPNYDAPMTRLEDDPAYRRHPQDWQNYHTRYVTPNAFRSAITGSK